MKKKMLTVVIIIVAVIVVVLAGWYIMFMKFGIGPAFPFMKPEKLEMSDAEQFMIADNALMAAVQTEEEAQELAGQYGIELVSFENGIALYHTDEDPFAVIARGQENGYSQLSINFVRTGYDADGAQ